MKKISFYLVFIWGVLGTNYTINAQNTTVISTEVKTLLDKKKAFNKKHGYGFCIQVYYGKESKAREILQNFKTLYPNAKAKLVYNNPEWKVQVGSYGKKIDADRDKLLYKQQFTGTIVVPINN